MTAYRLRPLPFLALALLAAAPLAAQEVVQALPGTTDADALAADMRRLAGDPRDVDALVDAARLSLRLDDMRAAAALLQRAENVNARDPRVKAGQGSVLVQSERPGQALRYFADADAAGLDPATFAADRGLAYDLTGQQERAQRDYARALRAAPQDDETIRRYALSLGISGQRQRALALLDPLVRRGDRAAWRSQAFVLAMTGDVGGAQRIAATMMPGGASGLSAFFERLPTLPATDRAFAVHFGEVRPSPERLADARLAPPVSPLPREPVALASAQPVSRNPDRRGDRAAGDAAVTQTELAAIAPPARREPARPALVPRRPFQQTPMEAAPVVLARRAPAPGPVPVPTVPVPTAPAPASRPAPTILAAAREPAMTVMTTSPPVAVTPEPATAIAMIPPPSAQLAAQTPTPAPVELAAAAPAPPPLQLAAASTAPAPVSSGSSDSTPAPVQVVAIPPTAPTAAAIEGVARPPARPGVARASEDSILARIIAGLSIPGAELGVAEPARPAPAPAAIVAGPAPAPAPGRAEPPAQVIPQPDKTALDRLAAEKRTAERKAVADKKALADRKAAADNKALADRKAAADKKALAEKEAAEKKIARSNPERIWVQVAGGAYEGDLPKAYAAVKARAPTVFGGRGGYTTPLRATNRVLTGPFRTDSEARAFVNDLKKSGVSAFTFTSEAGQPVKKLGAKGKADGDEPEARDDGRKPSTDRSRRRR